MGSNIANVGLILGMAACIRPVAVQAQVIVREIPFMLLVTACTINLGLDNLWWGTEWSFNTNDGITLLMLFTIFLYYSTASALDERSDLERMGAPVGTGTSLWTSAFLTLAGVAMVASGGELTVRGAEGVALALGVGREIIGLTIVAVGTSLPELATSVAAAIRKHEDIAIGNIVGSNIFNLLFILGVTATIGTVPIDRFGLFDLLAMFTFSAVLLPMCISNQRTITRLEGAILLLGYCGYIYYRAFYLGGLILTLTP